MFPSARKRIRSAIEAERGVVRDHHRRLAASSCTAWRRSSRISPPVFESRLPVGSSANTTVGFDTSARAIATRCCWPPESSDGRCERRSFEADRADQLLEPRLVGLLARDRQRQRDVLLGGEHRQQVEELEDEADVLAAELRQVAVAERRDLGAVDRDAAGGRPVEARRGCASASTCPSPTAPSPSSAGRARPRGRRRGARRPRCRPRRTGGRRRRRRRRLRSPASPPPSVRADRTLAIVGRPGKLPSGSGREAVPLHPGPTPVPPGGAGRAGRAGRPSPRPRLPRALRRVSRAARAGVPDRARRPGLHLVGNRGDGVGGREPLLAGRPGRRRLGRRVRRALARR